MTIKNKTVDIQRMKEKILKKSELRPSTFIKTGVNAFDAQWQGVPNGATTLLMADRDVNKDLFAVKVVMDELLKGHRVIWFVERAMASYLPYYQLSYLTGISVHDIRRSRLEASQHDQLMAAIDQIATLDLVILHADTELLDDPWGPALSDPEAQDDDWANALSEQDPIIEFEREWLTHSPNSIGDYWVPSINYGRKDNVYPLKIKALITEAINDGVPSLIVCNDSIANYKVSIIINDLYSLQKQHGFTLLLSLTAENFGLVSYDNFVRLGFRYDLAFHLFHMNMTLFQTTQKTTLIAKLNDELSYEGMVRLQ